MELNEKILLLAAIMIDIRGNWKDPMPRVQYGLQLAKELKLTNQVRAFTSFNDGDDGRHFRDCDGNYNNLLKEYGLIMTYNDRSQQFQNNADEVLTVPDYTFIDVLPED